MGFLPLCENMKSLYKNREALFCSETNALIPYPTTQEKW
jgi:hypothetical protein